MYYVVPFASFILQQSVTCSCTCTYYILQLHVHVLKHLYTQFIHYQYSFVHVYKYTVLLCVQYYHFFLYRPNHLVIKSVHYFTNPVKNRSSLVCIPLDHSYHHPVTLLPKRPPLLLREEWFSKPLDAFLDFVSGLNTLFLSWYPDMSLSTCLTGLFLSIYNYLEIIIARRLSR